MFVGAHAYLESSVPVQESKLDTSPEEVLVRFTEPINTTLSQLTLRDENGQTIPTEQFSESNRELILKLPDLDDGIYRVYWQVLALDTHVTDGSFRFSIGVELPTQIPSETISIDEYISGDDDHKHSFSVGVFLRISEVLLSVIVASMFFFINFILRDRAKLIVLERSIYLFAALIFIITGFSQVLERSLQLTNQPLNDTIVAILLSTNLGIASMAQPLLFLLLFLVSLYRNKGRLVIASLVFFALFFSFAWTGHGAESYLNLFNHTLHMMAISIWAGGIIGFSIYSFFLKKDLTALKDFHEKLFKFSQIALWSIIITVVSGALLSISYLNELNDLFNSSYGITLLIKLIAFSPVVIIAACHRYFWLPKLKKGDESSVNKLLWGLRIELLLIIVIVIIAGILSTTTPPV